MIALVFAIFIASVLGSMHCAGMCGAFLLIAVHPDAKDPVPAPLLHAAYHAGRLVTYTILGAAAGTLGASLNRAPVLARSLDDVSRVSMTVAGSLVIVFALVSLLRRAGVPVPRLPVPKFLQTASLRGHRAVATWTPLARALAIGLLTTLLPCGWLYAFVITASGTGNVALGAVTMGVFWLGTLPALIAVGVGAGKLLGPLRERLPTLTLLLVIGAGVFTIAGRSLLPTPLGALRDHAPDSASQSLEELAKHARGEVPICHGR